MDHAEGQNGETNQMPVTEASGTHEQPRTAKPKRSAEEKKELRERWKFGFEALATVAAFSVVALTWRQADLTRQAVDAAKKANEAAADANKISAATAIAGGRAWALVLATKNANVEGRMVDLRVKNYGNSPAIVKSFHVEKYVAPQMPRHRPTYAIQDDPRFGFIAPGDDKWYDTDLEPLTPNQLAQVKRRAAVVYIFGFLRYADIFGPDRETTFCMYWETSILPNEWADCPWADTIK
jgi:hypothetical protein